MFGILEDIWHGILSIPYLIISLLIEMVNGLIAAIALLAEAVLTLLPSFPEAPGAPSGPLGWLFWIVPIGSMLSFFALMVTCWVGFLGVKIALKWVKAL